MQLHHFDQAADEGGHGVGHVVAGRRDARTLFAVTRELLSHEMARAPYRLIGAGLSDFVDAEEAASDFFAGEERRALSGEKAMDALRARFGRDAVVSGRALRRKS